MKKMQTICLFLFFNIVQFSFSQSILLKQKDVKEVLSRMCGSFSTEEQAKSDTSLYNIRLNMVQFWRNNKNGYWLYIEQSLASEMNKPYRQRVYHLYLANDTVIASTVYELKNSKQYVGAWNDVEKFKNFANDSLVNRQGCAVYFHKNQDDSYSGSTTGKECLSSLRGALFSTSEVTLYDDKILIWDRGWNQEKQQVWGSIKSAYIFVRQKE